MDNNERMNKAQRVMQLIDGAIHRRALVSLEVKDKDGNPVTILAEMFEDKKSGNMALAPLARLFKGDPLDEVLMPDGGVSVYAKNGDEALYKAFGDGATAPV